MKWFKNFEKIVTNQSGNVVFTLFGAVAVVGALGAGSFALLKGPVQTMVSANQRTMAETRMEINAKLMMKEAVSTIADCDSDNKIEAMQWRDIGGATPPTNGGFFPDTLGTATQDPWNSEFGYCVWDHGTVTVSDDDAGCGGNTAKRLEGADVANYPYIAVISAGPDKVFQTSCNGWVDVAPADGVPDTALVVKVSGSDDLVFPYTYDEARKALSDYWVFDADSGAGTDTVMATDQNLDFANDVTFGGLLDFNKLATGTAGDGLILPDSAASPCTAAEINQLYLDLAASPPAVVMCDGAGTFEAVTEGSGTGSGSGSGSSTSAAENIGLGQEDPNLALWVVNYAYPHLNNDHVFIEWAAYAHDCGVKADGTAWCVGNGGSGQLGNGDTVNQSEPVQVSNITDFIHISVGRFHACGTTLSGKGYCWGNDSYGQLGDDTVASSKSVPVEVINVSNFIKIVTPSAGHTSCGLTKDNLIYCWGAGGNGIMGNGTYNVYNLEPKRVSLISDFVDVAIGQVAACGLRKNGEIWCWGGNDFGELGNGNMGTNSALPVKTLTDVKFKIVKSNRIAFCAVSVDNEVYCWGKGSITGDGVNVDRDYPVLVDDAEQDYIDTGTGYSGGGGLKSDGRVFIWGTLGSPYGTQYSPVQATNIPPMDKLFLTHTSILGLTKDVTEGAETPPVAPYFINKLRGGGRSVGDGHGLAIQHNSAVDGEEAALGFKIDATSTAAGDPLGASISAVRKGADGYGGMAFSTLDNTTTFAKRMYLDPDGDLGLLGTTDDVLAGLQIDPHAAAHGGWSSDYHTGLLVTRDDAGTNNIAYFGLNDLEGSANILTNKEVYIKHSDDTAGTVNSVLRIRDSGPSEFYGALDNVAASGFYALNTYSDTATHTPMYKFERFEGAVGAGSAVSSGDDAGSVLFSGHDGTGLAANGNAAIRGKVSGAVGVGNVPVDLIFGVDNAGSANANETLRLAADGKVAVSGVAAPDSLLHVGGRGAADSGVRVSNDTGNCSAATDEGTLRFAPGGNWEYCDGAAWQPLTSSLASCAEDGASFYDIAPGHFHNCALYENGRAVCWGNNDVGQQGGGLTHDPVLNLIPIPKATLDDVAQITSGREFSCARLKNGAAKCWGEGDNGRLGTGNTTDQDHPSTIANLSEVIDISAGKSTACAVKSDGTVWCWGYSIASRPVTSRTSDQLTPVMVHGISGAIDVEVNYEYSACALLKDGNVGCWGDGANYQLGNNATGSTLTPVGPTGLSNVTEIAGGEESYCALKNDGTVWCWGNNSHGQTGNGVVGGTQNTPAQIAAFTGLVDIAAGREHACAVRNDGTVWCWGNNSVGQRGDGGVTTGLATPQQVSNITNAVKIESLFDNTCTILQDGGAKCWGEGFQGINGDGDGADDTTPVSVNNPLGGCYPKYAFRTSTTYDGNLGGIAGADAICQARADAGGLPGTYLAWLSDDTTSPNARFARSDFGYVRTDGAVIATDWADLTDGTIATGLVMDEFAVNSGAQTWTATTDFGDLKDGTRDCGDWLSNNVGDEGGRGAGGNVGQWSDDNNPTCDNLYGIYCFQQ